MAGFESGEVMMGMLNVPSEINVKEPFFIHYEYDSSQVYVPTSFTENPFTENDSWEYQEEDTKESDGFPSEDMIEVESIKGSGELIKITVVGESAGGVSGEKVIRGEEGTVDAQVSKVNNYTCEGFVDLEGTVNNSFEFSNAGCNFRGGNVELSSGLMDLAITSGTNEISVSITKGGVTRTYLFEGEINVSSG